MFDIVKKLIMARQISMEKGEILLLNQRMVMAPAITFYYLLHALPMDDISGKWLYYACKLTNSDGYAKALYEQFGLKGDKLLQWMANSAQLAGWGEFEIIDINVQEKKSIVQVRNSAIAQWFKNSKSAVDHIVRGYNAGVAAVIFGDRDIDVVETKCSARGDRFCEFVCKPTNDFDFNSEIVSAQLDKTGEIEKRLREIAWKKKQ